MNLKFCGAARQVTGSMNLLRLDSGYQILVDCGLKYERGDSLASNANFPFQPSSINLLILTHAHIDHSGNIPTLIKQGYSGKIICTEPTAALVENLLNDSVNVQLIESKNRRKGKKGKYQDAKSLYGQKDVRNTLEHIAVLGFHKKLRISHELTIEFYPAGHILGAASVLLEVTENGVTKRIGFTGDLGQTGSKIVVDPEPMPNLDYLVSESTYGSRLHKSTHSAEETLLEYIRKNCINNPGRLVIPAFSVGRTQAILFTLNQLYHKGLTKGITVFTDSKLGILSTKVHELYDNYLNEEARAFLLQFGSLFSFPDLRVLQTENEQKEPMYHSGPCIIVSSAGMVEGGRIQEHVRNNIQNPLCTILIAGYCAEGTLGYKLMQGQPSIHIRNKESMVYAKVTSTDVFSAHPDRDGLLAYYNKTNHPGLKRIFLNHGDGETIDTFGKYIASQGFNNYSIPFEGESYEL